MTSIRDIRACKDVENHGADGHLPGMRAVPHQLRNLCFLVFAQQL
jgi:hypothetical protein